MGVTYNYGAGPTYTKIASQTLGSAAASVTFSSIPQGYTDLILSSISTSASDGETLSIRVGNASIDTGSNYSRTLISGSDDTGAASFRNSSATSIVLQYAIGIGSDQPSNQQIHFMNYSNTTTYKTLLTRAANFRGTSTNKKEALAEVGLWRSTSAIERIQINCSVNMSVGSTFTLYGIAAALKPKATGGTVTFDPATSKWIHTFTSSGVFTPTQSLSADYLVVAGAGGGGYGRDTSPAGSYGAGGGAGGAGTSGGASNGGEGGLALAVAITGTSTYYAGGGGGGGQTGRGGYGGGTATSANKGGASDGTISGNATAATANTGGGGGGAYSSFNGGNGGSGIVIVRYSA